MMKKISILLLWGIILYPLAGFGQADLTMLLATNNGTTTNAGKSSNPYKITCARDLDTLSWYVRCGSYRTALNPTQDYQWRCLNNTYFIFTQDIDMSVPTGTDGMGRTYDRTARASNFIPIGGRDSLLNVNINNYYCARGYWNGNNKKITNLTITGSNDYTGLFGYTKHVSGSASIYDLGLENFNISGGNYTGALFGYILDATSIYRSYVLNGTVTGSSWTGGMFGWLQSNCTSNLYYCFTSNVTVTGTTYVGGLAGRLQPCDIKSNFYDNYSIGCNVHGTSDVGGFCGQGSAYNCYAVNKVHRISGTATSFGGFSPSLSNTSYNNATNYFADTWKETDGSGTSWSNISAWTDVQKLTIGWQMSEADMKTSCFMYRLWKANGTNITSFSNQGNNWRLPSSTSFNNGFPVLYWQSGITYTSITVYNSANNDCFPVLGRSNVHGDYQLSTLNNGNFTTTVGTTAANPYQITTANDLVVLSDFVRHDEVSAYYQYNNTYGKYFKLMNDIDMSSITNFCPIGGRAITTTNTTNTNTYVFSGTFYGNGKTISNLKINSTAKYTGLFGHTNYGKIYNIKLNNPTVQSTQDYTGALIGYQYNYNDVCDTVVVTGGTVRGTSCVGGVCGCVSIARNIDVKEPLVVTATSFTSYAGGIAGSYSNYSSSSYGIYTSTNTGVNVNGNSYVGGLAGSGYVYNSYAVGDTVTGTDYVGGIVGTGRVQYSYSAMKLNRKSGTNKGFGGVCGATSSDYFNAYYNQAWKGIDNGTSGGNSWTDISIGSETGDPFNAMDMKTNCFVLYLLGTNSRTTGYWQRAIAGQNDDYPVLRREGRGHDAIEEPVRGECFPVLGYGQYRLSTSAPDEQFDANVGTTPENPYLMATAADFVTLAKFIKDDFHEKTNGNTYQKYFKIDNNDPYNPVTDINMASISNFIPIGGRNRSGKLGYPSNAFFGIFEGNNRVISNLTINSTTDYNGFFGVMSNSSGVGLVRNLGLTHVTINAPTGSYNGAMCGMFGVFSNCNVIDVTIDAGTYTGGFVGAMGKYTNSYVENATIDGDSYTGGFIGANGKITNCYVLNSSVINNSDYTGGFIGIESSININGTYYYPALIQNSFVRNVNVTGTSNYLGGFAGYSGYNSSQIRNCYASGGSVKGQNYLGGLSGSIYNMENYTTNYLFNCYSTDTVSRTRNSTSYLNVGGLRGVAGYNPSGASGTIQHPWWYIEPSQCFYWNGWKGQYPVANGVEGGTQKDSLYMRTSAFVDSMNYGAVPANPFMQDPPTAMRNYGYPIFKWDMIRVNNLTAYVPPQQAYSNIVATINASFSNGGYVPDNNYKFRYRKHGVSTWTYVPAVQDLSVFYKADLDHLEFSVRYYFQAFAVIGNGVGDTVFAPDTLSFFTQDYIIEANPATEIGYSTFKMNGHVERWTGAAAATKLYFKYWKASAGETSATTVNISNLSWGDKSAVVSGLEHSTQYNYRIVMEAPGLVDPNTLNSVSSVQSVVQTVWTKHYEVRALPAAAYATGATIRGEVTFNGTAPSTIEFEFWKKGVGVQQMDLQTVFINNYSAGIKTYNFTDLTPNQIYVYVIAAQFGSDWARDTIEFRTSLFQYPRTTILTDQTITLTDDVMTNDDSIQAYGGKLPQFLIQDGGSLVNNTSSPFVPIESSTTIYNLAPILERTLRNEQYVFVGTPRGDIDVLTYLGITGDTISPFYGNTDNNFAVSLLDFHYNYNAWNDDFGRAKYLGRKSIMKAGAGYMAYMLDAGYPSLIYSAGTPVKLTLHGGTLFYNDTSITLTNNGREHTPYSSIDGIWYAIGNPYPANLYTKNFLLDPQNISELETGYIYAFDENSMFQALDDDMDNKIKMGEGFFVAGKNRTATPSHTFTLKNSYTTKPSSKIYKSYTPNKITITAKTNKFEANAYIKLHPESSNGFDYNDAYKMFAWDNKVCEPYFTVDATMLVVNAIETLPYECPMNITSYGDNKVILKFSTIPEGIKVWIIDNNIETEVFNGSTYAVELVNGHNEGRFRIKIDGEVSLSNVSSSKENISLWVADKTLSVNGRDLENIYVYNALGQVVYYQNIKGNTFSTLLDLPSGTYTAKAKSNTSRKIIKFVITK